MASAAYPYLPADFRTAANANHAVASSRAEIPSSAGKSAGADAGPGKKPETTASRQPTTAHPEAGWIGFAQAPRAAVSASEATARPSGNSHPARPRIHSTRNPIAAIVATDAATRIPAAGYRWPYRTTARARIAAETGVAMAAG